MAIVRFRIKKDIDLNKLKNYGFEEETKKWVYYCGVVKMAVEKTSRLLRFNMPCNTTLSVYTQMVKDDIVEIINGKTNYHRTHYIGLTQEEYDLIQQRRIEKGEIL